MKRPRSERAEARRIRREIAEVIAMAEDMCSEGGDFEEHERRRAVVDRVKTVLGVRS